MRYELTSNNYEGSIVLSLSSDRYERLLEFERKVEQATYLEQKIDYVLENFRDYCMAMLNYRQHSTEYDIDAYNRRLMNLLSTAKSYVDGAPQHVGYVLGRDGALTESVHCLFRKEHSERLGYRVMSALRNHAQHCGFPLHYVDGDPNGNYSDILDSLDFYISIEKLETDNAFKASVLIELKALGEIVGIKAFLYEYIKCLWNVHQQLREMLEPTISSGFEFYRLILTSLFPKYSQGPTSEAIHLVTRAADGCTTREWTLPKRLEEFSRMRSKTSSLQTHHLGFILYQ